MGLGRGSEVASLRMEGEGGPGQSKESVPGIWDREGAEGQGSNYEGGREDASGNHLPDTPMLRGHKG